MSSDVPALDWIERDRREPDKVLANLLSARRQVFDLGGQRDRYKAQAARLRGELLAIASGHPDPQGTARRLLESGA